MTPDARFSLVAHAAHGGLLGVPWWTIVVAGPTIVLLTYLTLRATPPVRRSGWRLPLPAVAAAVGWSILGGAAVVALGAAVVVGWWGPERASANLLQYLTWLVPLAMTIGVLVLGDGWRRIDPVESLAALAGAPADVRAPAAVGAAVDTSAAPEAPGRADDDRRVLGVVPAMAFLAYWWVPSCFIGARPTRLTAAWLVIWVVWGIVAGRLRGRRWVAARDPFRLLADAIGRHAALRSGPGGLVAGTSPARRGDPPDRPTAQQASRVLEVMLGVLLFRLVAVTTWWIEIERPLRDWSLGGVRTLGLLWACALVVVVHHVAEAATVRFRRSRDGAVLVDVLGALAAGMIIGGLFPPALTAVQNLLALLSDPFGRGWDTFGTIDWQPVDLANNAVVAWLEPLAVIIGGIGAVAAGLAAVRRRGIGALDWPLAVASAGTVGGILWLNLYP